MIEDNIINKEENERTVLVGLSTRAQDETRTAEYLDELAFLAETAGAEPVARFTQKLDFPNPRTYVGTGKLDEIREYVEENEIGLVIFDDELSSKQVANIEKELKVKILDRTSLILDIFAKRAQTATARTQVELAQYQYLLPRLTRMWTHLERQRGGIGMRGPGETQIETDRRIILDKIARLKQELVAIDKQKVVQRKNRGKLTRVALVGYTNVGKSTLDEVRESDVIVHVVDISHPNFEEQIEVVNKTLTEVCGASDKPMIMVFNKIDAFTYTPKDPDDLTPMTRENIPLDELRRTWMARMDNNCVFISARERVNIDELKTMLYRKALEIHTTRFPYNDFLYQKYDDDTEV